MTTTPSILQTVGSSLTTIIPVLLITGRVEPLNNTLRSIPHSNNIVIVDSGDIDLLPSIDTSNIKTLIYRENNIGQWETRKEGLALVDTDYVHFLDADDSLSPNAYSAPYGHDMYQLFPRMLDSHLIVNLEDRTALTACSCQIFKTTMAREVMASLPIKRHNYNECFYFMLQALKLGYRDFVHHDSTVRRLYISGEMRKSGPPILDELKTHLRELYKQDISHLTDYYVYEYFRLRMRIPEEPK